MCTALSISRSNVLTKKTRSSDWADFRKSPPKADDADLKGVISCVVKDRATYGYRRVWARLKIYGRQINHKRVYQVMLDEGSLLFRQGQKPLEGLKPVTTPVTSPQSNGMAESFEKTLKRDYAKVANRPDSKTVMAQLKDWFDDYNLNHPHSALGYLPPTLFRGKRSVT